MQPFFFVNGKVLNGFSLMVLQLTVILFFHLVGQVFLFTKTLLFTFCLFNFLLLIFLALFLEKSDNFLLFRPFIWVLSQGVPLELGYSSSLTDIDLGQNLLTGSLSPSIWRLVSLRIHGNALFFRATCLTVEIYLYKELKFLSMKKISVLIDITFNIKMTCYTLKTIKWVF